MSFFDAPREAAGERRVCVNLSGLSLELEGLDAPLADRLLERHAPYASEAVRDDREPLRVRVAREARDYFIDPPAGKGEPNPVRIACDGERVRYLGYKVAGWFDAVAGAGLLLLARGDYEPDWRAIENYVRSAVAWRAAARGGALVHGASAVWNGRGYLFFGPSGAGKSTMSAANRRARVVSDDLSLVLPGPDGLELVGSPFRGTYEGGEPVQGRFPLHAGFRLIQAPRAEVLRVERVLVLGALIGNLPFVAEAFDRRPDLFERIERAFAPVPLAHLHFTLDDSYWDAISEAGFA
jgi:hypothetical protein